MSYGAQQESLCRTLEKNRSHESHDSDEEPLQRQVKSLQDLAATQERVLQKCVTELHKKQESIDKYKQKLKALRQETVELNSVVAKEQAQLTAFNASFKSKEKPKVSIRVKFRSPEAPAPSEFNSQLGSPTHADQQNICLDFPGEHTQDLAPSKDLEHSCQSSQSLPWQIHGEHIIELNQYISTAPTPRASRQPHYKFSDYDICELRSLLNSTQNLLKTLPKPPQTPRKRRVYRTCLLSRLTQHQLFQLNVETYLRP